MNRRRALWGALILPYKIPSTVSKLLSAERRYDEVLNNCQDFAGRLAAYIDFETGISEKQSTRYFGRNVKVNYYTAKMVPIERI